MKPLPPIVLVAILGAGCAAAKPDCCPPGSTCCPVKPPQGAPQPLAVVDSLEPIKAAFNASVDKPRAVLLVSPVCSECVYGAEVVRKSIMDRFAARGVHAIVVWEPMIEPDTEAAARQASGIFADVPASQFWDTERHAGWAYQREHFSKKWDEVDAALPADHWLRKMTDCKPESAPEWDVYMLFKPGVRWEAQAPKPDAFIRHMGRDEQGRARYWRDRFNAPPTTGDLHEAMENMARDVLGEPLPVSIELLGFPACPHTATMRQNLVAALKSLGGTAAFRDVNQEELPESDIRRGWPAPTVLLNGADLFGMPAPSAPSMGCRIYPGGVPSAAIIATNVRERSKG